MKSPGLTRPDPPWSSLSRDVCVGTVVNPSGKIQEQGNIKETDARGSRLAYHVGKGKGKAWRMKSWECTLRAETLIVVVVGGAGAG